MPYKTLFPELYGPADTLQILGSASRPKLGPRISILVWNIYKARLRGWEQDFRSMVSGYDLILLQESLSNEHYDTLFKTCAPLEWVMARTYKHIKTAASTGVQTGCIAPSQGQRYFVSAHAEPVFKTPKMLLATTYALEGSEKPLLVVNVHAINFVSLSKFSHQIGQIMEAIGEHDGPVLLAGDFNTWNGLRYKSLMDLTEKLNLQQASLTRKTKIQHLNRHLDHVFFRGLELESGEVLLKVQSSDHYPIGLNFRILPS